MRQKVRALFTAVSILLIASCGADSSFNQLFTLDSSSERLDAMIAEGKAFYDDGEYDKAVEVFDEALETYPSSEEAAVLGSYSLLGSVGLGFFDIVKVMTLSGDDLDSEQDAKIKECASLTDLIATNGQSGKIDCLMGIDSDEDVFGDQSLEEIRVSNPTLAAIASIVENLCPFFASDSLERISGDSADYTDTRHQCGEKVTEGESSNLRGSLVWSLAHLFEAAILNIQAARLEESAENLSTSTTSITEALSAIGNVINQGSDSASFIDEAISDLDTVTGTLGSILGEDSEIGSLSDAADNLKDAVSQAFGDKQQAGNQQGDVTQKINQSIVARETELDSLTEEETTEFCEGYLKTTGSLDSLPQLIKDKGTCS